MTNETDMTLRERISARYPDEDDRDLFEAALTAGETVQRGDAALEHYVDTWQSHRAVERLAMAQMTGALAATVRPVGPETELAVSRAHGLNRMTVRRALAK